MRVWNAVKIEPLRKSHVLLLGHGHPRRFFLKLIEFVKRATKLGGVPRHFQLPHSTSELQSHRIRRRRYGRGNIMYRRRSWLIQRPTGSWRMRLGLSAGGKRRARMRHGYN